MDSFLSQWKLSPALLPKHIGIIMDGNGRWASKRLLPRVVGHKQGVERVREITEICGKIGIYSLSLYAFSEENWKRPEDEILGLMSLLRLFINSDRQRLIENNVVFRALGDKTRLDSDIVAMVNDLENATQNNNGLHLNVALSYGGQGEIVRAIRAMCQHAVENKLNPATIDNNTVEQYLDTRGLPPVDLLIRTSGEQRISNFLLWQIAYAELAFDNTLWPDFTTEVFAKILQDYTRRERRFGTISVGQV